MVCLQCPAADGARVCSDCLCALVAKQLFLTSGKVFSCRFFSRKKDRYVYKLPSKQKLPDPNQSSPKGFVPAARFVQQHAGRHLVFHHPWRYTDRLWPQILAGMQKFPNCPDTSMLSSSDPRSNYASTFNVS